MNSVTSHGLSVLGCVLALTCLSAHAKEYNKPKNLPADGQATVNSALAETYRLGGLGKDGRFSSTVNTGCGNVNVGNVTLAPGQQAPREVNTVVLGNVINVVNRGCR